MRTSIFFLLILTILFACDTPEKEQVVSKNKSLPNIIYILADDLGYGDLSCYNENSAIKTTHIDQLAASGMRFTDAHSGSSVCTPTRYGIMTGRYSWRSKLEKGVTWSYDSHLMNPNRMTVADLLKQNGYQTGCVGKWHLGWDWGLDRYTGVVDFFKPINYGPNEYGFDYFFGIGASLDIPPYFYVENDRITATKVDTFQGKEGMLLQRTGPIGDDFKGIEVLPTLTERSVKFITESAANDKPYFLYFPLPAPHTPLLPTEQFKGKSNTNLYGDFVLMVDDLVGQIMAAVAQTGQAENTLIIFTSDNGCSPYADFEALGALGHDPSYVFRGHKADIFEGGHRIPFIATYPDRIPANTQSDETICLTDFMRTCASMINEPLPENAAEDSYDLLPILTDSDYATPLREATIHHSVNGSFAIRSGKWKLLFCPGSGGWSYPTPQEAKAQNLPAVQLYDLETDAAEATNLAAQYPKVVDSLTQLMQTIVDNGRSMPGENQSNDREVVFQ